MSRNLAIIDGYLGQDAEVRTTNSGSRIVNLNVATSEGWTDKKTGERKEKTQWHKVVSFNDKAADYLAANARKGSFVMVVGSIQERNYTAKDGTERSITEIVARSISCLQTVKSPKGQTYTAPTAGNDFDSDIPF